MQFFEKLMRCAEQMDYLLLEKLTQIGNAVKQSNLEDLISQVNNLNSKVGTKDLISINLL